MTMDEDDLSRIYQSPESGIANIPQSAGRFRLDSKPYKFSGIGLVTFLGGGLCGGVLLFLNERKRVGGGCPWKGAFYGVGCLVLALLIVIALAFAGVIGLFINTFVNLIQAFVILRLASGLQGVVMDAHLNENRPVASNWKALGVGVITSLVGALLALGLERLLKADYLLDTIPLLPF